YPLKLRFCNLGYKNVTLMDIAKNCGISTGNLNYHFKKKDDLIESIYERYCREMESLLAKYRVFPDTKAIDNQVVVFFKFQLRYKFLFLDLLEVLRDFPKIAQSHNHLIQNELNNAKATIDYGVGRGIIKQEPYPQAYDTLALSLWTTSAFWLTQHKVRNLAVNLQDVGELRRAFWHQLLPFFTEKGIQELIDYGIVQQKNGALEIA
ncbi:MAG: TetR/AcrR family transcriptional regulator, partial [Bacteroidota bacterium]